MHQTVDPDRGPALRHRHRPGIAVGPVWPRGRHLGLVAARQAPGQVTGTEDGMDLHLGVTQLAHQQPSSRAREAHPTSIDLVTRTWMARTTSCAQAWRSMSSRSDS